MTLGDRVFLFAQTFNSMLATHPDCTGTKAKEREFLERFGKIDHVCEVATCMDYGRFLIA